MNEANIQIETEYQTRHVGLAAFLRYGMGDASHIRTQKVGSYSTVFIFNNPERCKELEQVFFSRDGAATGNARELLDCARAVKMTVAVAQRDETGTWLSADGI